MGNEWIYYPLGAAVVCFVLAEIINKGDENKSMQTGAVIPQGVGIILLIWAFSAFAVKLIWKVLT
jgi:hypothetical protein